MTTQKNKKPGSVAAQRSKEELLRRKRKKEKRREIFLTVLVIALCLVVPPIGLMVLWSWKPFDLVARITLSLAAVVVMTVLISMRLPVRIPESNVTPVMKTPALAERAKDSEVMASLTDLNVMLASQQQQNTTAAEEPSAEISSAETMQQEAAKQALLSTHVFTTSGRGTRYYHAVANCGGQKNSREITLAEALAEHLGACPDCNAPISNILSTEKVIGDK